MIIDFIFDSIEKFARRFAREEKQMEYGIGDLAYSNPGPAEFDIKYSCIIRSVHRDTGEYTVCWASDMSTSVEKEEHLQSGPPRKKFTAHYVRKSDLEGL
jgi:hypothetical protein